MIPTQCPSCRSATEPETIGRSRTHTGRPVAYCPRCDLVIVPYHGEGYEPAARADLR